jgi:four helix bundle protein
MVVNYRNNKAWQKADELVMEIYDATRGFPQEELYVLTSQMRRAAISVAANIAEGTGRKTEKDYLRFLYQARGSLTELEYYIHLSVKLGYLSNGGFDGLRETRDEAGRVLQGLIKHITANIRTTPQQRD